MNKIKILLIDDNPLSLMEGGGSEKFIPTLNAGFSNPEYDVNAVNNNFELGWLQSPRDVVEFRTLSEMMVQKKGEHSLIEKGFVPEIILFDYRLQEKIAKYIEVDYEEYKNIIPTHKLTLELNEKSHRFFDWDNETEYAEKTKELKTQYPNATSEQISSLAKIYIKTKNYDKIKLHEPSNFSNQKDDMGCYAGGVIALQFKEHPCIGTPITSKEGETDISNDALYFEWLLEKDFDNQFGKKYGKKPFWDIVIPNAVLLLRNRIQSLVVKDKITLNLTQLLAWTNENPTEHEKQEREKRTFTFQSVYGVRHLPLDGLFIDVDANIRDATIKDWVGELIEMFEWEDYKVASEKSKNLLDAFKGELFEHRMKLSELAIRICNCEVLSQDDMKKLNDLLDEFGVVIDKTSLTSETLSKANLSKKVIDFRTETESLTPQQKRLVVLFTDLRLHLVWQRFKTINQNSSYNPDILNLLISPPTKSELRAALFPVAKNPLILDYHRKQLSDESILNKNHFDAWEKAIGEHLGNDKIFSKKEYPINLKDGEIRLAKSFCLKNEVTNEHRPDWLKNK